MAEPKRLRFTTKKGTWLSRKKISRINKTGAIGEIKVARSFVLMTIDYRFGNLHVELDVERSGDLTDIRQMAITNLAKYAQELAIVAQAGHVRNLSADEQAEMAQKAKQKRSEELAKHAV